jgi:phage-related holin
MLIGFMIGLLWMTMIETHKFFVGTFITILAILLCYIIKRYISEWLNGGFDEEEYSKGVLGFSGNNKKEK